MVNVFDILGVVLGVLGLASAVPIIVEWAKAALPSARLRQFDEVAYEAESLLNDLFQDEDLRLHTSQTSQEFLEWQIMSDTLQEFQDELSGLRERAQRARLRSYQAVTTKSQLYALFSELSSDTATLYSEVAQLRAKISVFALEDKTIFTPADMVLADPSAPSEARALEEPLRSALRTRSTGPPPYSSPLARPSTAGAPTLRRIQSLPSLHPGLPPYSARDEERWLGMAAARAGVEPEGEQRARRRVKFANDVSVLEYEAGPV